MKSTSKLVLDIISNMILKKRRDLLRPEANLREELGIDSIKLIAIAAMLIEKGIDVNAQENNVDFSRIETVQDIIEIADRIANGETA